MGRTLSLITFTSMTCFSIVLPIALVLIFNPELFQSTDPEMLGCEGPLAGLGLCSGLLMAIQMRVAIAEPVDQVHIIEQPSLNLSESYAIATLK